MSGKLYIVATPIGNMQDITERAISVLRSVDLILAEDTRVTMKLLMRLGIKNKVESYHKFSEKRHLEKYTTALLEGTRIALVSDAGTPAISDPGKYLVKEALDQGIDISPIPGPSAAAAAFSVSGCMNDRFIFGGFLPSKGSEREKELQNLLDKEMPFILYESPNRIDSLIELLEDKDVRIVITREVTKQFEEIIIYKGDDIKHKGEFTVVVEPLPKDEEQDASLDIDDSLITLLKEKGLSKKDVSQVLKKVYPEVRPNVIKKMILK